MNQLLGLGITGVSVLIAIIVSGLRLKPYLDTGVAQTPLTFAFYPALIATAISVPIVFLLRWWQGKKSIDIGPVTFMDNFPFVALGCLVYVIVAVAFFPYQPPPPTSRHATDPQPSPLSGSNISVF